MAAILRYKELRLGQLRAFCACVQYKSYSAAARVLETSQPSVWQQVRAVLGRARKSLRPRMRLGCRRFCGMPGGRRDLPLKNPCMGRFATRTRAPRVRGSFLFISVEEDDDVCGK
jgi:hypothetical protein